MSIYTETDYIYFMCAIWSVNPTLLNNVWDVAVYYVHASAKRAIIGRVSTLNPHDYESKSMQYSIARVSLTSLRCEVETCSFAHATITYNNLPIGSFIY